MDYVVEMNHLFKDYGRNKILKDINFKIKRGEIFGLLGPSGSGKTTIIKHIAGIEKATKGNLKVFDVEMPTRKVSQYLGYMGQSDALYEDLTGYENLIFFASLYGLKGKHLKKDIKDVLDVLDLSKDKNKKVSKYSGGMKKRLSLAIVIIHKPKLLILDEPTVGIDPVLRKSVWELFYKMRDEGKTLIVTTHVMEEIEKCNRAALIRDGSIFMIDEINKLKTKTKSGKIEELFFIKEE